MSSAEHPSYNSRRHPIDVVQSLAEQLQARNVPTHGRFAIRRPNTVDAILSLPDGGYKRLFTTREDQQQLERYQALRNAAVPQLNRQVLDDQMVIYELPLNAKLLSNERLFADRTSTETYVSDHELFHKTGALWSRVWQVTNEIPTEIINNTLIVEFGAQGESLYPAPAYDEWGHFIDETEALQFADAIVMSELQLHASNAASFRALTASFTEGWQSERNS